MLSNKPYEIQMPLNKKLNKYHMNTQTTVLSNT